MSFNEVALQVLSITAILTCKDCIETMLNVCPIHIFVRFSSCWSAQDFVAGVGKTTLVKKMCHALRESDVPARGFYTEELRVDGRRTGFDIVTLDGKRGPLARVRCHKLFK